MIQIRNGVITKVSFGRNYFRFQIEDTDTGERFTKYVGLHEPVSYEDKREFARLALHARIVFECFPEGIVRNLDLAPGEPGSARTGLVLAAEFQDDERIKLTIRNDNFVNLTATHTISELLGELASKVSDREQSRMVKAMVGREVQFRPWLKDGRYCDIVPARPRRKRGRKGKPRLKAVTSSEFVGEVAA